MSPTATKTRVGELRPSQLLFTFGVGAMVDLPNLSVMVMGLDDWPAAHATAISEDRLLSVVRHDLGQQVTRLLAPPVAPEAIGVLANPFDDSASVGVPVAPFPRWVVCPFCRLLAPLHSGMFHLKIEPYRKDRTRYVHVNCHKPGRPPAVVPARFLAACAHGHVDDFPWVDFVHHGPTDCRYQLRLYELGATGEAADIEVKCNSCQKTRRMAEAFGEEGKQHMPRCRGRWPHLRSFAEAGCTVEHMTTMLLGASNSWFPVMLSALSLPTATDRLGQLVAENWADLEECESPRDVKLKRKLLRGLAQFTEAQIWDTVERQKTNAAADVAEVTDLKTPEWQIFSNPATGQNSRDFQLRAIAPPPDYARFFDKVVLVERLREVRALIGFTRLESPGNYSEPGEFPEDKRAPLTRTAPQWVPTSEVRGEGIFLQFSEAAIHAWMQQAAPLDPAFFGAHRQWRTVRGLQPEARYPTLRYVLLHSFAHALIRQLSLECGYTTASLRERIYSRPPGEDTEPMAGVLIYTAAADSEGTLGGLVSLGVPQLLGRHLEQALEGMRLCASDPLCAEHHPYRDGLTLHGAACHACLFAPETSCERGNKYLDRSVLVPTVERDDVAFFLP